MYQQPTLLHAHSFARGIMSDFLCSGLSGHILGECEGPLIHVCICLVGVSPEPLGMGQWVPSLQILPVSPWLGGPVGGSTIPFAKRLQVQSPVEAHTEGNGSMAFSHIEDLFAFSPPLSRKSIVSQTWQSRDLPESPQFMALVNGQGINIQA